MRKRQQLETFDRPIYGADPDSLRRQPSAASVRRARNACMAHFYSGPLKIVSASAPSREWVSLIRRIISFLFRSRSHALWQAQGLPFDTNRHRDAPYARCENDPNILIVLIAGAWVISTQPQARHLGEPRRHEGRP